MPCLTFDRTKEGGSQCVSRIRSEKIKVRREKKVGMVHQTRGFVFYMDEVMREGERRWLTCVAE